ncbi:MAG: HlyD family secretion protein [Rhodanobacteraceae bacterium]
MTDKQYGAPKVEKQAPKKPKRKWLQRSLWIAGPLVVAVLGGWFWVTSGRYVSTDNAYVGADQANIAPQVPGRVVEVDVQQNQPVHKGDVLFRIDPKPYELAVQQLQAQMHAVGDYLASSRDSYAAAQADLRSQQSSMQNDLVQLKRIRDLHKKGLVSQKELDDAANAVASARGDRDSAAANAAKAKTMLGGNVDAPVDQLSGFKAYKAQMEKAQLDLEHTTVRAPFDGVIGQMSLQEGDFLQAGEKAMPLIAMQSWVDANFKETDLTHVAVGQKATITLDTYPDYTWHAKVKSISPASGATFSVLPAQNATGNWVKVVQRIPVRLEFTDNTNAPVARVGMSAQVDIDTGAGNSLWNRWFGADGAQESGQLTQR